MDNIFRSYILITDDVKNEKVVSFFKLRGHFYSLPGGVIFLKVGINLTILRFCLRKLPNNFISFKNLPVIKYCNFSKSCPVLAVLNVV